MTARRAIIGLCAICALLISAVAAQGAGAVGTTVDTCRKEAGGTEGTSRFSDPDCTTVKAGGEYGHFKVEKNTRTQLGGSGGKTILKATLFGAPFEVTVQKLSPSTAGAENWMENVEDKNAKGETEMVAKAEGTITYEEVTISIPNCGVKGLPGGEPGMITTKVLKATTLGQGMGLKFEPQTGTVLAEYEITGTCAIAGQKVTVTGSVIGTPNGAKVEFTHLGTTTQNTLKANGAKTGIEGSLTLEGRLKGSTGAYTPLSFTT